MSVVTPPQASRPTLAISRSLDPGDGAASEPRRCDPPPAAHLNERALFYLLERHRTARLRDLYHGRRPAATNTRHAPRGDGLPPCPPRFQCLDLSLQRLLAELELVETGRRGRSRKGRGAGERWRTLDRVTRTFLEEAVIVLRRGSDGDPVARRSGLPCSSPLAQDAPRSSPSAAITPPPSPRALLPAATKDAAPPQEIPREIPRNLTRGEVAMSDDEIRALWNRTEPSVDSVDLYLCLETDAKQEKHVSWWDAY